MAIMVHEEVIENYWAIVPCRGSDSAVTAWVVEDNIRGKEILFRRGSNDFAPLGGSEHMRVRLSLFRGAVRRALDDDISRLAGHGNFVREGGRVIYTTLCGESYSFAEEDLQLLVEWATAED